MTTFAEAKAACTTRWGTPSDHDGIEPSNFLARWDVGNHEVILTNRAEVAVRLCLDMCGAPEVFWTLDGEPAQDAPLTSLTEALNAADTLLGRPLPQEPS